MTAFIIICVAGALAFGCVTWVLRTLDDRDRHALFAHFEVIAKQHRKYIEVPWLAVDTFDSKDGLDTEIIDNSLPSEFEYGKVNIRQNSVTISCQL